MHQKIATTNIKKESTRLKTYEKKKIQSRRKIFK